MGNTKARKNQSKRKLDYFSITMTDMLRACFSNTSSEELKNEEAIDFFLYMTKYNKITDEHSAYTHIPDRQILQITLADHASNSDTPEISILLDFLKLHILNINDTSKREPTYSVNINKTFTLKPPSELLEYCKEKFRLDLSDLEYITQDSVIDIIVVCFLAGRHGLPVESQHLRDLLAPNSKSKIRSRLNKVKSNFIVIYGDINEQLSHYMLKYTLNRLYGISHHIDFDLYQKKTTLDRLYDWVAPKYENIKSLLYSAILNAFLQHREKHYIIIHGISSYDDLHTLTTDYKLCKNVILLCNFHIESPQSNDSVTYVPFNELYTEPCETDIKYFFKKRHISDTHGIYQTLLMVSNGNLFLLHTLEILIDNLSKTEKLKNVLDSLSLEADENTLPTNKYSMSDLKGEGRSGNNLIGHIRKLYKSILSIDEWLLILFIALHGEKGVSKEWLLKIFSKNILDKTALLINKNLIYENQNIYTYKGSLLIPYSLAYGKHKLNDSTDSFFSDVFNFLNFMLDEICYYNSTPIDYNILFATITKTYKHTFSLLSKSSHDYHTHFAEIWYYHIRCVRFFLENGDITTVKELNNNFKNLMQKLFKFSGEYNHWKKLYKIYIEFLELCTEDIITSSSSWERYIYFIEKFKRQLSDYNNPIITQLYCQKLLLLILESLINLQLEICISGLRSQQINPKPEHMNFYIMRLLDIKKKSELFLQRPLFFYDENFFSEIRMIFQSILWISGIYAQEYNYESLNTHPAVKNPIPYTEARYRQLLLFKTKCTIINQLCSQQYSNANQGECRICCLLKEINKSYYKLGHIPLSILEDYYYALTNYVLYRKPSDSEKLIAYIHEDMKRYKHIWKYSEIMKKLNNILLRLKSHKNYDLENDDDFHKR